MLKKKRTLKDILQILQGFFKGMKSFFFFIVITKFKTGKQLSSRNENKKKRNNKTLNWLLRVDVLSACTHALNDSNRMGIVMGNGKRARSNKNVYNEWI